MADIFISYAREDRPHAEKLARGLEAQGWSVWWDRTIPAGRSFDEVIEEAIEAAKCMIVIWSRSGVASDWVREEAQEGKRRAILVPVLIEEKITIPLGFRRIQAANLAEWDGNVADSAFHQLTGDIASLLGPPPADEERQWRLKAAAEAEAQRRASEDQRQRQVAAKRAARLRRAAEWLEGKRNGMENLRSPRSKYILRIAVSCLAGAASGAVLRSVLDQATFGLSALLNDYMYRGTNAPFHVPFEYQASTIIQVALRSTVFYGLAVAGILFGVRHALESRGIRVGRIFASMILGLLVGSVLGTPLTRFIFGVNGPFHYQLLDLPLYSGDLVIPLTVTSIVLLSLSGRDMTLRTKNVAQLAFWVLSGLLFASMCASLLEQLWPRFHLLSPTYWTAAISVFLFGSRNLLGLSFKKVLVLSGTVLLAASIGQAGDLLILARLEGGPVTRALSEGLRFGLLATVVTAGLFRG